MFKCLMGPGLGPQGKCEGLCVGSFNNCFGKFVPFFNGPISFFSLSDHQNKPEMHKGKSSKERSYVCHPICRVWQNLTRSCACKAVVRPLLLIY